MKTRISVQERLKDLRVERGLNLEELAQETGISKSALGSYENDNDEYKEINHGSLLKLADFYQVSVDYLLGLTNNRRYENTPIEELHLSDEVVELLKSERFNNRLLCEIISHEKFKELLADAEIYVDGIATMHFHDTNSSLAALRAMVLEEHPEAAADRAIKVLEACQIEEEDFFCHVTHKTWDVILHDIRKAHENDSESAPDTTPADELIRGSTKGHAISGGQGSAIHGDILQGVPAQIQAALTRGTKPFEKAVQEIPADKTVWYELPAQAVEIKTAVVGFCSYSGCFYL